MNQKMAFFFVISIAFLLGIAYGVTARILWEYKMYVVPIVAAMATFTLTKNILYTIVAGVLSYILIVVVL